MEFDENRNDEIEPEYHEDEYVDIYSKRAIFWFSFFNFLFGGVLLVINLYTAGFKKAVPQVLLFLLLYYMLSSYIVIHSGFTIDQATLKAAAEGGKLSPVQWKSLLSLAGISLAISLVGAFILSGYFFKKYFPDKDYYPKPILMPLLIMILLSIVLRLFI